VLPSLRRQKGSGDSAEKSPLVGGRVVEVVVGGNEFPGLEVAEDIGERPGSDDLAISPDGEFVRNVGEAAGRIGCRSGRTLRGKECGRLAFHGCGCRPFGGCAVAEDNGDEDSKRSEQESEDESVPSLAGACQNAGDGCAEDQGEEDNECHSGRDGTRKTVEASSRSRDGI
jgi:hypothetical protein